MKVMVTGGGGFIGGHLVDRLAEQGLSVSAIDLNFPEELKNSVNGNVEFLVGDFRDEKLTRSALDGCQVVYHLASAHLQSHLPKSTYWDVNVNAVERLLRWCKEAGVKRFVHTGTVGVYGDVRDHPANELSECRPQSIYGETKLEGEQTALRFQSQEGFPVVVLRPAWVYGPRCPRTERLFRMLRKGRFIKFGKCRNYRHPVYIEDMLDAFELAAESEEAVGEVFLIADDEPVTVSELIRSFCSVLGVREPRLRLPLAPMRIVAALAEAAGKLLKFEPPFSRRSLEFFTTNNAFDISKAKTRLGYAPKFTLEGGLRATLEALSIYHGVSSRSKEGAIV
jgi:nucleoside-diphosphate-sugar epimerase